MPKREYYLEVLKEDEQPKWPVPEDELTIGSQTLPSGYIQYWAYPKDGGREAEELPPAEIIAQKYQTSKPAVLIDEPEPFGGLELTLVKDGHAWGKSESSLPNLDDNLNSILSFANSNFNIKVEHFITTERVSERVERKLDDLEKVGQEIESSESISRSDEWCRAQESIKHTGKTEDSPLEGCGLYQPDKQGQSESEKFPKNFFNISKFKLLLILLVLIVFGGIAFKDQISSKLAPKEENPAPTVVPTETMPTPTPTIVRKEFKVRVLNGTTKTGAAASLAETLKAEGWEIIKVGNASKQDFIQTVVKSKQGMENAVATMILDLSGDLEASASGSLDQKDQADLEVVIGKK